MLGLFYPYGVILQALAIVHFVRGRYTDAIPKLKIVLDWQPGFRDARYLLATSLARAGRHQR